MKLGFLLYQPDIVPVSPALAPGQVDMMSSLMDAPLG